MFHPSFRTSAYFEQDGARRGYLFKEPEGLDLFIDEQLKEATEREIREKEESEQKLVSNVIKVLTKTTANNN